MKTCPICVWGNFQSHHESPDIYKKCVVCGYTIGVELSPDYKGVAPHTTGLLPKKDEKK